MTKGEAKFRIAMRGGREAVVKKMLLRKMGIKMIYGRNDYNGTDPLLGFQYQGKMYPIGDTGLTIHAAKGLDGVFDMITTGNLPEPVTEFPISLTQNGWYVR